MFVHHAPTLDIYSGECAAPGCARHQNKVGASERRRLVRRVRLRGRPAHLVVVNLKQPRQPGDLLPWKTRTYNGLLKLYLKH